MPTSWTEDSVAATVHTEGSMAETTWAEQSVGSTSYSEDSLETVAWDENTYLTGYQGEVVVIGGAPIPVMPDGTNAVVGEVEWTEESLGLTTYSEDSAPAPIWAEDSVGTTVHSEASMSGTSWTEVTG